MKKLSRPQRTPENDPGKDLGVKVLVVDDSPVILELVAAFLRERGARVLVAPNAREAREVLAAESPDVVLTDLEMPGDSGIVLLEWIAARRPEVRGLLMTGSPELAPDDWRDELLEKPFCFDALWERILQAHASGAGRRNGGGLPAYG